MQNEKEAGIKIRNEWQRASISLLLTYGQLYNSYESFFKDYELTSQQYNSLRILNDFYPEPVSTSVLRSNMLDKMSDTSRLVSRLQAKGYVTVSRNVSDKRLVNILISEKGQELLEKIAPSLVNLDAYLTGLSEEEATQLSDLLRKVRHSIETVDKRKTKL